MLALTQKLAVVMTDVVHRRACRRTAAFTQQQHMQRLQPPQTAVVAQCPLLLAASCRASKAGCARCVHLNPVSVHTAWLDRLDRAFVGSALQPSHARARPGPVGGGACKGGKLKH
jgi:hypothetical protein